MIQVNPAPVQEINDELLTAFGVKLFVKREDLIHPFVSGNKWRKLKYNLVEARKTGFNTLLTFGGAFSNHIYATAAAGKEAGFSTIGIIRGDEVLPLNSTLQFAKEQGMQLHYVDREEYKEKDTAFFIEKLRQKFGDFYLLPEGGTNKLAVKGCAEMVDDLVENYDFYGVACGTGGTMAGLIGGLKGKGHILGFPVLKGADFLSQEIERLLLEAAPDSYINYALLLNYHFGGYAKISQELIAFINSFYSTTGIPLDPIYTGKMFYGIFDLIKMGYFPFGTRILAIHTGGLQGINGIKERYQIDLPPFGL
jgi:1-aminocyclopropane-1-carboxylate deaminase